MGSLGSLSCAAKVIPGLVVSFFEVNGSFSFDVYESVVSLAASIDLSAFLLPILEPLAEVGVLRVSSMDRGLLKYLPPVIVDGIVNS